MLTIFMFHVKKKYYYYFFFYSLPDGFDTFYKSSYVLSLLSGLKESYVDNGRLS